MSTNVVRVAAALMVNPDGRHWGYALRLASGVRSGALYPTLQRFLEAAWITDGWEDPTEVQGRPPRRYYQVTELGRQEMTTLIEEAEGDEAIPVTASFEDYWSLLQRVERIERRLGIVD